MTLTELILLIIVGVLLIATLLISIRLQWVEAKNEALKNDRQYVANENRDLRQEIAVLKRDNRKLFRQVTDAEEHNGDLENDRFTLEVEIHNLKPFQRIFNELTRHNVYIRTPWPNRKWIRQKGLKDMDIILEHTKKEF